MADFVSVLRRAVGNLENNTEAARQAIYGKARAALRAQLEAIDPPLGPDDISRQIQNLDKAIGEIEVEFAPPGAGAEPAPPGPVPPPASVQEPPRPQQSFQSAVTEAGALGAAASTAARQARETLDRIGPEAETDGGEPAPLASRHEPVLVAPAPKPARPASPQTPEPVPPTDNYDEDDAGERGGSGRIVAWIILLLVLAGIAGVAVWQRDAVMEMIASLTAPQESTESTDNGKIADRLPGAGGEPAEPAPGESTPSGQQPAGETPAPAPAAPPSADAEGERIAQALLIEESVGGVTPANTLGGSVDWQLLDDAEAVGGAEKIIRGDVDVPEKDLGMTLTIRRNTDEALPASHLIELVFRTGPGFAHEGIASVPGLLMKATPRSTGQPLVGAVVPVMDGYFLVGLSESDIDRERNVQEITLRDFIDIPVAYKDGGRAVLSLAKGESGKRVFEEAFATWGQ